MNGEIIFYRLVLILYEHFKFIGASIYISEALIPFINKMGPGKNLDDKVNMSIVVGLFASKNVTLARAAELAELSLGEFILEVYYESK